VSGAQVTLYIKITQENEETAGLALYLQGGETCVGTSFSGDFGTNDS
jgi:hypothetical protein